jgi:hypothetical protein
MLDQELRDIIKNHVLNKNLQMNQKVVLMNQKVVLMKQKAQFIISTTIRLVMR